MGHILDYDGKFINFSNKATDTLIATLLCLVCSIPIITIGASTTAYYSVMLKLVKDEESYITKSFFKAFKENFKIATIVWLILGVIGAVLLTSIYIVLNTKTIGGVFQYALPLYVIIFLFYYMVLSAAFAYIAQFYDGVRRVLKLSWQFVVKYIWSFLIMTVVDIVMWVIVIKGFTVFIVFLPEISGFVHAYLLNRMFTKEIKN
ncbi:MULTISPECIES: YesL family protein [unclassified Eubacterium (in: firmicutes)]|jgi:uncharacterized membrane protein YesL|uniref:YesL family protein n=1 Tax=Eubacterium TaxID=1730 RepID=UPI000E4BD913|nr:MULTISPECIES: YesL family protein [unclassified Eubacterium (in: firmicutes)]RGF52323.1 DUF624 domain-containing protein [Eubacterium sp. AF36-5BH]RHP22336.1 DUF624 domain-containing protein [Eubacterium sp. AF34-35BH]